MIDALKLYNDIETLQNDILEMLKSHDVKIPNIRTMKALVACHDLLPYLSALIALQYGKSGEQATEMPEVDIDPSTGTKLTPSPQGKECLGNGTWVGYECCCDECDYFLECFPEYS